MDSSQYYCTGCKQYFPRAGFPLNLKGDPYKTCLRCKARRAARRLPLAETDPNAPRQTRNGPIRSVADGENPRPRKRIRRTHDELNAARNQPVDAAAPPLPPPPPSPPILPPGFRSRFQLQPEYDIGAMDTECEACRVRHWISEQVAGTNQQFELCCKRGDAILELLRPPPAFLRALFEGCDPQARSFR
ncbi:hypothetical protein N431DRAFT_72675 [Stipitochalara longipes BDJ]|nr:hypothetical protein N431DRAFT_72675 [Stipitochalara longipes BDJ]